MLSVQEQAFCACVQVRARHGDAYLAGHLLGKNLEVFGELLDLHIDENEVLVASLRVEDVWHAHFLGQRANDEVRLAGVVVVCNTDHGLHAGVLELGVENACVDLESACELACRVLQFHDPVRKQSHGEDRARLG